MKDWVKHIQQGKSKQIAREFFINFTNCQKVGQKIYSKAYRKGYFGKKKNWKMPFVNNYFKEWQRLGFMRRTKTKLQEEVKVGNRIQKQPFWFYRMDLKPVFKFCEEKGIIFTDEEKKVLDMIFISPDLRKKILGEFPDEDIINATLKFFLKNYILVYFKILKDIRDNPSKYKKYTKKAEELQNPTTELGKLMKRANQKTKNKIRKKFNLPPEKINWNDYDTARVFIQSPEFEKVDPVGFQDYFSEICYDKDKMEAIEDKILRALNLNP